MISSSSCRKLSIRPAREEDICEIFEIEVRSFKDPYPRSLLKMLLQMARETFLVAELNGKVVGYVILLVRRKYLGHILSLAVSPHHRRKGIATALLASVEERARTLGVKILRLEVRVSNLAAIKLYLKLGFKEAYQIPQYYRDNESAIIMFKILTEKNKFVCENTYWGVDL
ncbi:MAG: ribosomal protein S18-alanine N-acetyltransferase [archaeon GB-1867-005]|nr:ribosomal protein S18-alanine N-acetyltransferase [Candidatus Culexmicrobium cathedralense]